MQLIDYNGDPFDDKHAHEIAVSIRLQSGGGNGSTFLQSISSSAGVAQFVALPFDGHGRIVLIAEDRTDTATIPAQTPAITV